MERTDQRENKTAGSMTSHTTCTRQLDNGENRQRGQTRQLGKRRMHPAQEPQLASDMRYHVCLVQELGGLWIVKSLAHLVCMA